jgi:carbon storage regulator
MLVLTRKQYERVVIDGDIVITILKVGRDKIQVGIEAPRHVSVKREELLSRPNAGEKLLAVS